MGSTDQDLKEKARIARDAVADLEEPLKTEAFKIVLAQLLNSEAVAKSHLSLQPVRQTAGPSRLKPKVNAAGSKMAKSAKKAVAIPSTLKLGVETLKKLSKYCERFVISKQGTEQIAFILVNFLRENTDLEVVTAGDVAYLYRQLIALRVKVPAVNNADHWTRALSWLTAPSRRKEWLEKSGEGYVVSNAGLLRWHEFEAEAAARSKEGD